uniref:Single-stranded DNA-binding protein n=1 Tax=uncultured Chloroflexota bacterium TaxID=166587 RepID=H5SAJ5_9CHLR|nr:single-strand binding protein [uncultured Chloroflexota bacterium]
MFHTLIIIGNLGRDPEMRYTPSGQPVTSFSVATNRRYTAANGEQVEETLWFRVTTWGKLAETCNQYLKKGSKVLVEGRLTGDPRTGGPRIWNGQDGQPRASFEVTAQTVRFLSGRGEEAEGMASAGVELSTDEDIPF